jgi:hypothetical protein
VIAVSVKGLSTSDRRAGLLPSPAVGRGAGGEG